MGSKLVSKSQAAALLAVSERTIDRMIERGELPALKLGAKAVRIPEEAVLALLRSSEKAVAHG